MNKKRFLGILLALALALGLMVGMTMTAYAVPAYNLWVGGVEVTPSATSGDGWSYDVGSNTLTLSGATITTGHVVSGKYYGIYYSGTQTLKIDLASGTVNRISVNMEGANRNSAIYTEDALSLSGTGKLTVEQKTPYDVGIDASGISISDCELDVTADGFGVLSFEGISVKGAKVTVTSINSTGIFSMSDVTIDENSNVTAAGAIKAIYGTVKNDISGIGWTNTAGTEGKADIPANTPTGQDLSDYEKVQFPAVTSYNLWVGDVEVTSANASNIDGNNKASYDAKTKTLTLNGYSYGGEAEQHNDGKETPGHWAFAAIYAAGDLTISLSGENIITNTKTYDGTTTSAIYTGGDLTFSGTGTLIASGVNGLYSDKKLTIPNGAIWATGEGDDGAGIRAGGDVSITGGDVTATGVGDSGKGIDSQRMDISNASVTAYGTGKGICYSAASTFKGSTVYAYGGSGEGIYSKGGTLTIDGGTVTATSDSSSGINTDTYRVFIQEGSNVTATGATSGIGSALVVSELAGVGWTDAEGTKGKEPIPASTKDQDIRKFKKVQFPAFTVTYKVVGGTWSDDTTPDKTEAVASGSKPADVPTGMKPSEGYEGGAWDTDPTKAAITKDTTFTYTFTAIPTYTVTYKVVGGTWEDGTTADKTETVQSGAKPVGAPTGMKPSDGYEGGAWDRNPADTAITEATTFTYTFEVIPTCTVTYRVVGGTWEDGTTEDRTETVQSGEKPADVPTGMKPFDGYAGGEWNIDPTETTITGATTFTYVFTSEQSAKVTKAPTARTLIYNGYGQELVNAGKAEGGTMVYALGTDAITAPTRGWKESIPVATEAGTYYVWYKAVGDAEHTDSEPVVLVVTISPAKPRVRPVGDDTEAISIRKCEITVVDRTYTGRVVIKPEVTVMYGNKKLVEFTDYTVSYDYEAKEIGAYRLKVKGKGNYTDTKTLTFRINPKGTAFTGLKGGWRRFKATWKKQKNITGYQIQYGLKSDFSDARKLSIGKAKKLTATIKKLETGKLYYVRIRTYARVKGKKYYSEWSKAGMIKTSSVKGNDAAQVEEIEGVESLEFTEDLSLPEIDVVIDGGIVVDEEEIELTLE